MTAEPHNVIVSLSALAPGDTFIFKDADQLGGLYDGEFMVTNPANPGIAAEVGEGRKLVARVNLNGVADGLAFSAGGDSPVIRTNRKLVNA